MALEKLSIRNFQAIRELDLDVDEMITSIIGESDSGKSAIVRALIWVLTNKIKGEFITWGQTECRVTLNVDGHEIVRLRNKSKNIYLLDGMEFACLRKDVPSEISNILKISEDSIQGQFDPVFWFSSTEGDLAKKLNSIVNLEVVDFTFSTIASEMRDLKVQKAVYEERLEDRKKLLPKFDLLSTFQTRIDILREIQSKISENTASRGDLERLIKKAKRLSDLIQSGEEAASITDEWKTLSKEFFDKQSQISSLRKKIEKSKACDCHKEVDISKDELKEIDSLFQEKRKNRTRLSRISSILGSLKSLQEKIMRNEERLAKKRAELKKAQEGKCPLCGRIGIIEDCCITYDLERGVK